MGDSCNHFPEDPRAYAPRGYDSEAPEGERLSDRRCRELEKLPDYYERLFRRNQNQSGEDEAKGEGSAGS